MPFHSPIGIQFGGGLPTPGLPIRGTAPITIGGGRFQSFPGSPGGTLVSPPGSRGSGTVETFEKIANIFTQFGQGYRLFSGGQEVVVIAPQQGPTQRRPGEAGFSLGSIVPLLLIGGLIYGAVKLLAPASKKKK